MTKLSFENGGDFILDTRREVDVYLASRGTQLRGHLQLYVKAVVAFGVLAAANVLAFFPALLAARSSPAQLLRAE